MSWNELDLGPLAGLLGGWTGDQEHDLALEEDEFPVLSTSAAPAAAPSAAIGSRPSISMAAPWSARTRTRWQSP